MSSTIPPRDAYGKLPVPKVSERLKRAASSGEVVSLGRILEENIPYWKGHPPYSLLAKFRHGDLEELAPASASNEQVTLSMHTGTHIDAFTHFGRVEGDRVVIFGGYDGKEGSSAGGIEPYGAHHFPPIFMRGVFLDVAGALGYEVLPDSYGITAKDIKVGLDYAEATVENPTCVLIRTGFGRYWNVQNQRYSSAGAGLTLEAAQDLVERGACLIGSDTESTEQTPLGAHPVHQFTLIDHGVPLIENLDLEELAIRRPKEFLFIALPLKVRGATASIINPVAVL